MKMPHELFSYDYLAQQLLLHASPRGYGGKGDKWAPAVAALLKEQHATSILDYGCGQGTLARALRAKNIPGLRIAEYDPAIPGKDGRPSFADLIVCTDVLEHIEPRFLSAVLANLRELARKAVFVVIATRPASKTLDDGRNAHLIIEDAAWWDAKVKEAGFTVLVGPPSPSKKPSREWVALLTP